MLQHRDKLSQLVKKVYNGTVFNDKKPSIDRWSIDAANEVEPIIISTERKEYNNNSSSTLELPIPQVILVTAAGWILMTVVRDIITDDRFLKNT